MPKPTCGRVVWVFNTNQWKGARPGLVLECVGEGDGAGPDAPFGNKPYHLIDAKVFLNGAEDGNESSNMRCIALLDPPAEGDAPREGIWAEWMPYQVGQAAKNDELVAMLSARIEALEQQVRELNPGLPPAAKSGGPSIGAATRTQPPPTENPVGMPVPAGN